MLAIVTSNRVENPTSYRWPATADRCLHIVFAHSASFNRSNIPSLGLVCRTSLSWMLPILYNTVALNSSGCITRFFIALKSTDGKNAHHVHALWIGPVAKDEGISGSLRYGYSHASMITEIINLCSHLRIFALINFNHDQWSQVEDILPSTLNDLTVGPIHGPLDMRTLAHVSDLQSITSVNTYLRDDEVQDILLSSGMRHFRRVISAQSSPFGFAMEQLPVVSKSKTLEKMEILVVGPEAQLDAHRRHMLGHPELTTDKRIVFSFELDHGSGWHGWLYNDFKSKASSKPPLSFVY